MRIQWCWRCRREVPMLDRAEFRLVERADEKGLDFVEAERRRRELPRLPPIESPDPGIQHFEGLQAMLEMYRLLTGYEVRIIAPVYNHRIARHGPPVPVLRQAPPLVPGPLLRRLWLRNGGPAGRRAAAVGASAGGVRVRRGAVVSRALSQCATGIGICGTQGRSRETAFGRKARSAGGFEEMPFWYVA